MRRGVLSVFFVLMTQLASNPASAAQREWDPLAAVTSVVDWLEGLNASFDQIVQREQRAQLLRSVDRTRKDLYTLELDTRFLLDSIPDEVPSEATREHIAGYASDLLDTVNKLADHLRSFGADLRLEGESVEQVEGKLTSGIRTRARVLTFVEGRLKDVKDNPASWQPDVVREQLRKGLQAVGEAQRAITEFQKKLAEPGNGS